MNFAQNEEQIIKYWQEKKIFEKSIEQRPEDKPFIFYDGPPFATGLPHYGHILSSVIKDVIPRYKTMRGFRVPRHWGWDCHGLPIENMIEKQFGISGKKDIEEKIGVAKFNETCHSTVLMYAQEWKKMVERIGRWVDFDDSYKTMDIDYMESVWWVVKNLWDKGLIYEGKKVLMYCPRCETPISKAEVAMDHSYKDVKEETIIVKFKVQKSIKSESLGLTDNAYMLVWTTTPWTLPANVALAVGEDINYGVVRGEDGNVYILASNLVKEHFAENVIEREIKGSDLIGVEYESLFKISVDEKFNDKIWRIYTADFVSTEEGTGIVHIAPAYGEDDYNLSLKEKLPVVQLLDDNAFFNDSAPEFIQGKYFEKVNKDIRDDLAKRDLLFAVKEMTHSYPYCWRCETKLIYKAISAWFIDIQKNKSRMIELNEKINWYPKHLKHGRFLNILETAPDWNISRNRYWATPLPIWICESCKEKRVIGSKEEIKPYIIGRNRFIFIRHGRSTHNEASRLDSGLNGSELTQEGKEQIKNTAEELKKMDITKIFSSPLHRAQQTAEIISKICGVSYETDDRLWEFRTGALEGKHEDEYISAFGDRANRLVDKKLDGGESLNEVGKRMLAAVRDYNSRFKGEIIAVVSHGDPLWVLHSLLMDTVIQDTPYMKTGSHSEISVNEIDLHRPYIDEIEFDCKCGGKMKRIPEVIDCWVESASMPFAEHHYPFENKEIFEKRFPGDYIAEYIAQTRAWFYYMHVISTLLFDSISFKNCVTTGTILNEKGEKLSKSKRNFTDPWTIINQYGVDALRYYLMTGVVMQSENLFFNDKEVRDVYNKVINILWNVFSFYQMYADKNDNTFDAEKSGNVLDIWILSKLNLLIREVTEQMDQYNTIRAGRPIKDFINELSTWYLRRSRERLRGEDRDDQQAALAVLRLALLNLSKLMAPLTPFISETIYQKISDEKESVHLEDWPREGKILDESVLENMELVRWVVGAALEERAKAGISVRQVLQTLEIDGLKLSDDYLNLIKEEINVKQIKLADGKERSIKLDVEITDELRREGLVREITRHVNAMRKELGLTIEDRISLYYQTDSELVKGVFENYKQNILENTLSDNMYFEKIEAGLEKDFDFDGETGWIGIRGLSPNTLS